MPSVSALVNPTASVSASWVVDASHDASTLHSAPSTRARFTVWCDGVSHNSCGAADGAWADWTVPARIDPILSKLDFKRCGPWTLGRGPILAYTAFLDPSGTVVRVDVNSAAGTPSFDQCIQDIVRSATFPAPGACTGDVYVNVGVEGR